MPIRPLKLPNDLDHLYALIIAAFHYPENPEWNIDPDEVTGIKDTVATIRRIWPLYRMINWMSPALRDALLGYIWEEDGIPVGLVTLSRRGSGDSWMIGNVGVLPEYRRRGIARKLVEAGLGFIRQMDGSLVVLDVVTGNLPAYQLYLSMGFEHYSGAMELEQKSKDIPLLPPIPERILIETMSSREWKIPFNLAKKTVPENIQAFDPVTKNRYHRPLAMHVFTKVLNKMRGVVGHDYVLRDIDSKVVVAVGSFRAQAKTGARHSISMTLNPTYADLASFLVGFLLYQVKQVSPDHYVQAGLWKWESFALDAHQEAGFKIRKEGHRMGMNLK